jgi:hypothetical protein
METAQIIHAYIEVLAWPTVAVLAMFLYRGIIRSLLPGAKVKLTISGVTIETTIPMIEEFVTENLGGQHLTREQWAWLKRLRNLGSQSICDTDKLVLRPLRNAGLLRTSENGFLQDATAVEITRLGRLIVDAKARSVAPNPEETPNTQ